MKKYEITEKIPASAADLLAVLTTADYVEKEAMAEGAIKASVKREEKGGKILITTNREDPGRGPGGKVAGKTEKSVVTANWDSTAMRNNWTVKVPGMEKMFQMSGETWIESLSDDSCKLCEKGSVNIKMPLVGDVIAKGIISDIKKDFPKKIKLMKEMLS